MTWGLGGRGPLGAGRQWRRHLAWPPRGRRRRHKGMARRRPGSSRQEFTRWGGKHKLHLDKIKLRRRQKEICLVWRSKNPSRPLPVKKATADARDTEEEQSSDTSFAVLRREWKETYIVIPKCMVIMNLREVDNRLTNKDNEDRELSQNIFTPTWTLQKIRGKSRTMEPESEDTVPEPKWKSRANRSSNSSIPRTG